MNDRTSSSSNQMYDVTLGHSQVRVTACTREDALAKARRAFSLDMPRLYDVIYLAAPERFEITPIDVQSPNGR